MPNLIKQLKLDPSKFDYKMYLNQGKTVFFTVIDKVVVNMIAVEDPLKETALGVIKELKRRNITPYMITGDNKVVANVIAKELGIDHVYSEVLPHEKANIIAEIQKEGKHHCLTLILDMELSISRVMNIWEKLQTESTDKKIIELEFIKIVGYH